MFKKVKTKLETYASGTCR